MGRSSSYSKIDAKTSAKFLFVNIITIFGCPLQIVSDRGLHFLNDTIKELNYIFYIKHWKSTPYNPKANGLIERAYGIMVNILNKIISAHKIDWDIKLQSALWAYRTAEKITTERTPFYLVNGMDSIMLVEFEMPTYTISTTDRLPPEESLVTRLEDLEKLEEDR
jgi:transposase InsO family protein